ncbi:hypothetical protein GCM10027449_09920 [Sinomonas notoginsengisoli]|uniref:DUF2637 domain-containing protein n=1 Tax=Sinomonas notoginsengisoli TaxID=1457311 RepID=UPI001F3247E0|nr:DUF2637 domain-containing protein [Sinomonas notoginsengisoli]
MNPQNPHPAQAYKPISKPIVATGIASTVVIGSGAFVLSFSALTDLAVRAGINPNIGWMWPLIVDGMIVAATVAIVALAGRQGREQFYPWVLLFFGAIVSTAANSIHAILAVRAENGNVPVIVSALVAAMPPVVLLAITHLTVLLVQYARNSADVLAAQEAATQRPGVASGVEGADGVRTLPAILDESTTDPRPTAGTPSAETKGAARPAHKADGATPSEAAAHTTGAVAAKPKTAPKRKPRKVPATAAQPVAAPPAEGEAAPSSASTAARATPGRTAAKSGSASVRPLVPGLSAISAKGSAPHLPQITGTGASGGTGTTAAAGTTPSAATASTASAAAARNAEAAGDLDGEKELASAQA